MLSASLPPLPHHTLLKDIRALSQAHQMPVLLVGGAVRDWLIGAASADLDFAVQGNAIALARAVANVLGGHFYVLDHARGAARVILRTDGQAHLSNIATPSSLILDFSTCRGATWEDDLLGRDFTINAIALDLRALDLGSPDCKSPDSKSPDSKSPDLGHRVLLDPTGGLADLSRRIIRQVRPNAIAGDPVRALRAARLALALAATIEPDTARAMRQAAAHMSRPSPERVRDELMKLLELPNAAQGVRLLDSCELLGAIVPEIKAMRACTPASPHVFNVLEHTFVVMDYADRLLAGQFAADLCFAPDGAQWAKLTDHFAQSVTGERSRAALFRFALLLHDSGKPATHVMDAQGNLFFPNHAAAGAELAGRRARALKLSNDETRRVGLIVRHHTRPNQMARTGETSLRALYHLWRDAGDCMPELALLCVADGMGKAGANTPLEDRQRRGRMAKWILDTYYTRFAPAVAPQPLIQGEDVLALGIAPGPKIGQMIESVREAQMAGDITTRAEALAMLRLIADDSRRP